MRHLNQYRGDKHNRYAGTPWAGSNKPGAPTTIIPGKRKRGGLRQPIDIRNKSKKERSKLRQSNSNSENIFQKSKKINSQWNCAYQRSFRLSLYAFAKRNKSNPVVQTWHRFGESDERGDYCPRATKKIKTRLK